MAYQQAYRMAIEYRKWLTREIFELIFSLETRALKPDANMVLSNRWLDVRVLSTKEFG